jgi:hypothetical protein
MPFTGAQVETFDEVPSRLFHLRAHMFGVPLDVLHVFTGASASIRVTLGGVLPIADARGPEMDRSETVTVFNGLCVIAPAALLDATIGWHQIDEHDVRGTYTRGHQTVRAELTFDDDGDLIDFTSEDRLRASADGKNFTPQAWSTPIGDYRTIGDRRIATTGAARWRPPDTPGAFTYLEFTLDELVYNTCTTAFIREHGAPHEQRSLAVAPPPGRTIRR